MFMVNYCLSRCLTMGGCHNSSLTFCRSSCALMAFSISQQDISTSSSVLFYQGFLSQALLFCPKFHCSSPSFCIFLRWSSRTISKICFKVGVSLPSFAGAPCPYSIYRCYYLFKRMFV